MDTNMCQYNDITIIGSGPSSLLYAYYLSIYHPKLKITIVTNKMELFRCTYCVFISQIEDTWILKHISKNDLFLNIVNIDVNCDIENTFVNNHILNDKKYVPINDKYGIINNHKLYFILLNQLEKSDNIKIVLGTVNEISKCINFNKLVYYYNKQQILNTIKTKFVIEGIGNYKPIGIKYTNKTEIFKQIFVGYKIKIKHNINKCILMDWYSENKNYTNSQLKQSFCYIIPYDKNILLVEETILIITDEQINNNGGLTSIYSILEKRLIKRLKHYNLNNYTIINKEINTIIMNKSIPDFKSYSLGVGQCGNMINITSGYTIGYNIYHIPIVCDLIIKNNYNTYNVYYKYWNYNRYLLYKINTLGQYLLDNLDSNEIIDFQYHYFKYIVNNLESNYNHRIMFLNCDNNNELNYKTLIESFRGYYEFPFKYIFKIIKILFTPV